MGCLPTGYLLWTSGSGGLFIRSGYMGKRPSTPCCAGGKLSEISRNRNHHESGDADSLISLFPRPFYIQESNGDLPPSYGRWQAIASLRCRKREARESSPHFTYSSKTRRCCTENPLGQGRYKDPQCTEDSPQFFLSTFFGRRSHQACCCLTCRTMSSTGFLNSPGTRSSTCSACFPIGPFFCVSEKNALK